MLPIDLALFEAHDRALPGREACELNELCRAIVELVRTTHGPTAPDLPSAATRIGFRRGLFFLDFQRSGNWR
jgi:hypothetical protein